MTTPLTCADARDLLPDLALGMLSGDDRAGIIDHLGTCPACAAEAGELSGVVDDILLVAPEVDPPAGFESAVLARIERADRLEPGGRAPHAAPARRAAPARPAWRRPRVLVGAIAATVVLVTGVGAAVVAGRGSESRLDEQYAQTLRTLGGKELRAAPLAAHGETWGAAFVYEGRTSWVFVSMSWDAPDGDYRVMLDRSDGPSAMVGHVHLVGGAGSTGMTVGNTHTVTAVRVVDPAGRTLCTATLPEAA